MTLYYPCLGRDIQLGCSLCVSEGMKKYPPCKTDLGQNGEEELPAVWCWRSAGWGTRYTHTHKYHTQQLEVLTESVQKSRRWCTLPHLQAAPSTLRYRGVVCNNSGEVAPEPQLRLKTSATRLPNQEGLMWKKGEGRERTQPSWALSNALRHKWL